MRAIFRLFTLVLFVSLTACGSSSSGGNASISGSAPSDVNAAHDALLSEATGYFAEAGGTGGKGGSIYYVTNLNDSGPGSLRAGAEQSGPMIILFEDGVNGTINLSEEITVRSNKTIAGRHRDGSSADIYIDPAPDSPAAFAIISPNRNVIITNLKGDASGLADDDAPDFIFGGGGLVWVHHVTVIGDGTTNMDGFVDVHSENVTLSWNRVENWDNVHLVYPIDADKVSVTLHHNLFRNTAGRHPKTQLGDVDAHAYNNWLDNWGYDGMRVDTGGIVAENNIFTPGPATTDKRAIEGAWAGSDNTFLNGAFADSQSSVFTPPYFYNLDPTGTPAQQQALRDRLEAEAGWQSSFD